MKREAWQQWVVARQLQQQKFASCIDDAYLILNCQLSYFAIQMNITFAVQVVYSKEQKHTFYNALFD